MITLDIFNPNISKVTKGLEGKTVLAYGGNSTGKTKQATRSKKPFYLGFESGINAISGIPFLPMNSMWSNFKKINKQLTAPKTVEQARATYSTIIFDTVEASAQLCQDYICQREGVNTIGDIPHGGGYKMYEVEYWREINKLTSAGFTVYFISHEGQRTFLDSEGNEYTKIYPKGDKRSIDPICDLCDIIVYLKPNGLDVHGKEINSSAFMVNTPEFLSRSRFDYMVNSLESFTIENLEKAISDAIDKEEEVNGVGAVTTFEENATVNVVKERTFEELHALIGKYAQAIQEAKRIDEYIVIVEEHLGKGNGASTATPNQIQQLEMVVYDLEDKFEDLLA